MRVTQLETHRNLLTDLEKLNRDFADVNRQLSSTKKLNILSDSPFGSASLVDISEQALRLETYRFNIIASAYQLNSAESALNAVNNAFVSIHTLGMQAATETLSSDSREAIVNEIKNIRDELVARGNTQVDGRYLFAGSSNDKPPFELNNGVVEYKGNENIHSIPVGDGVEVVAGVSGSKALGAVFDAVDSIIASIDNSIAGVGTLKQIGDALGKFQKGMIELGQARGQIGVSLSMVDRMSAMLDTRNGVLREQRSHIEDANIAEVAVRIQQLQTAIDAALSSGGAVLRQSSLFDIVG